MLKDSKRKIPTQTIIDFWFQEIEPKDWFVKNAAFDANVRKKFLPHIQVAMSNQHETDEQNPENRLALILLLDQMTRNVFRDTSQAFTGDKKALKLSLEAIRSSQLEQEADPNKRTCFS